MSAFSRRAIVVGIATAPAIARPALALTDTSADARLRELWAQYLENLAAERAVVAELEPARAAYDAEEPPWVPGERRQKNEQLWKKHGLDRLYEAWNDAHDRMNQAVDAILEQEAEGLFGIGAKLAALPCDNTRDSSYDQEHAIRAALGDIDRLIGTSFLQVFAVVSTTSAEDDHRYYDPYDYDDETADEAVSMTDN